MSSCSAPCWGLGRTGAVDLALIYAGAVAPPLCCLAHAASVPDTRGEEDSWLSKREELRLAALASEARRRDFRMGRWAAKRALALHLDAPALPEAMREFEIDNDANGAPRARWRGRPAPCALSISHSGSLALAAVGAAGVPLGCDVESLAPGMVGAISDYLVASERELLMAAGSEAALVATLFWSAKESALKAWGQGLRIDPRLLCVEFGAEESLQWAAPGWRSLSVAFVDRERSLPGSWMKRGQEVLTLVSGQSDRPHLFEP